MARYSDIVRDQNEVPIVGALIAVKNQDGSTPALTDDDGNTLVNPLTSDSYGTYYFNLPAPNFVDEEYYFGGRLIRKNYGIGVGVTPVDILDAVDTCVVAAASASASAAAVAEDAAQVAADRDLVLAAMGLSGSYVSLAAALAAGSEGQYVTVAQSALYAADTYLKTSGSLGLQVTSPIGAGILAAAKIAIADDPEEITPLPVAALYYVHAIDGLFTDGRFIPSRGTSPTRNMLQRPDFSQSVDNSAVITAGQADPWGGTTAFRVQLPASNSYATMFKFSNAITPTEAGDYRVGFTAKSNTGAGNQNFTLHKDTSTPNVTTAVTEAGWTTGELQLPGMTNTNYVSIYNPSGTTPLDLIIAPLSLSEMEVKLPAHPIPATGGIVGNRLSRAGTITLDAFGNIVSPFKGRINFSDDGIAHRSFSAMTMWVTFKKTASSAAFSFNAPIWARTSGQPDLVLGTEANLFSIKGPGLTSFTPDNSWNAYGDEFLTLCIRFDATRTVASLGSIELATGTGTGGTPFEIPWAWVMGGFNDNNVFPGLLASWGVFDSYLEDAQLASTVKHVEQEAQLFGNTLGARNVVFSEGDSITNGAGATASYGYMQQIVANLGLRRINAAVSGTGWTDLIANPRSADFIRKISQAAADGRNPIVHCMIGTNSAPVPAAVDYQARVDLWRGLGATVIVGTIPDRTSRSSSVTAAFNAGIRTLTGCTIADYAADARIGAAGAAANPTYFNGDNIHPNDAGHAIMAPIGQAAIAAARV